MTTVVDEQMWGTPQRVRPPPNPLGASLRRVGMVLVVTGVLVDLSIQTRAGGLAATAAVVCLCVGLMVAGRVVRPGGRLLLAAVIVVASFLFLRSSPWLVAIDLATVSMLIALACSAERDRRPFDTRFVGLTRRLWATACSIVTAPPRAAAALASLLPRGTHPARRMLWQVVRGLVFAVPILAIIGVSLASADPVFASLFDLDLDAGSIVPHVVIAALGMWLAAGFFVQASCPPVAEHRGTHTVGAVEGLVVMTGLTGLYGVFAASQVVVARRGADYVLETTGLTYAEYARSGFFQLLWVAAITVVLLVSLRSIVRLDTAAARRSFAAVGVVAALFTVVIVHSAVVRLGLYDDVFGLTRLRFYSAAFAWWLGVVFVLVAGAMACSAASRRSGRDWLPTAIACSAVMAVVILNLVDPDATVVQHNLARAQEGAPFDVDYARALSSDATPVLAGAVDSLTAVEGDSLRADLCPPPSLDGPIGWNVSLWRAADATEQLCG